MSKRIGSRAKDAIRDVKRESSKMGRSFARGLGVATAEAGIAGAMANPVIAAIIIIASIIALFVAGSYIAFNIGELFMNPLLWALSLIMVALFRPKVIAVGGFATAIGIIMWLIEKVFPAITAASNNWFCGIPIIGKIGCGVWYGSGLMASLLGTLLMYGIVGYIIIYALAFIDAYLSSKWGR